MQGASLYHILPKCIFRETFQDLASVMKNGGVVSNNVTIKKSVCIINSTGNITYPQNINLPLLRSFRVILKLPVTSNKTGVMSFVSIHNSGAYNSFSFNIAPTTINYQMGASSSAIVGSKISSNTTYDMIFTWSMTLSKWVIYVNGSLYGGMTGTYEKGGYGKITIGTAINYNDPPIYLYLVECYNYALSITEALLLYQQTLYNDPTR